MRWFMVMISVVIVGVSAWGAEDAREKAAKSFGEQLAPVFKARCLSCHGDGKELKGKLDLRTREGMLAGGETGSALTPGKPFASPIYTAVRYDDELKMPPDARHRFSRDQTARVKLWIEAGAPWPDGLEMKNVLKPRAGEDPTNPKNTLPNYKEPPPDYQYQSGAILIPAAREDEPVLKEWSASRASRYLDEGALAWTRERQCLTCHTNGAFLELRPALTPYLGPPLEEVKQVLTARRVPGEAGPHGQKPGFATISPRIHVALALAEWDRHVTKSLSKSTDTALRSMIDGQLASGAFNINPLRWVPYILDEVQFATVAARAIGTAPGWLEKVRAENDEATLAGVEKLRLFLRNTTPAHDYDRVHVLWADLRWPGILDAAKRDDILAMLSKHQRPDGGWSMRSFAKPEEWGTGNRAARLKAEKDANDPRSDGHMTGLAIIVLREAGVPADDPRIRKGIKWLKANQRESGRWWTKSLNTDFWQFSTYHGTAHALLALGMCGEIPHIDELKGAKP